MGRFLLDLLWVNDDCTVIAGALADRIENTGIVFIFGSFMLVVGMIALGLFRRFDKPMA